MNLSQTDAARPSLDELMGRAAELRPEIAERARQTEQDRRVSADIIAKLRDAELLDMCKPARWGGFEYGPTAMVRLGFEIGQACGSTAWCAGLSNCNSWFGSYWSAEAQEDMWGTDPRVLLAAPLAPTGTCEVTDGGYLLSGQWPYASNCENAEWTILSAVIPPHDDAPPGPAWFVAPMSELEIDQDSWFVSGLQGTGSKTLVAKTPIFVPAHRMVRISDVVALTTPGASIPGNVMARFGWSTFGAAALVAPLLGMAQGAIDWSVVNLKNKRRPGSTTTADQNPFLQERIGRASASLDAAKSLLLDDLARAESTVFDGERLSDEERIRIRRDFGFVSRTCVEIVDSLYDVAGASGSELSKPIQRFWRDTNAGARHVSLDDSAIMAMVGQHLLGLEPVGAR